MIIENSPWNSGILDEVRRYSGWDEGSWSSITKYRQAMESRGVFKLHGRFRGPDFQMLRGALLLFCAMDRRPDAVLLVRDCDHQSGRVESAKEAAKLEMPFPFVIASPQPEIEVWLVRGFIPETPNEVAKLDSERAALGFDPTLEPQKLVSMSTSSDKDAKAVLLRLTEGELEREARCLLNLKGRAHGESGLERFFDDAGRVAALVFAGNRNQ